MTLRYKQLEIILKKACKASDKEISIHCYAGGPFEMDITCGKAEDAPGYLFYLRFTCEDDFDMIAMSYDSLKDGIVDLYKENASIRDLDLDKIFVKEEDVNSLQELETINESTQKLKEERTVNVRFLDDSDADYIFNMYLADPQKVPDVVDDMAKSYSCHVGDCERKWDYYNDVVDLVFEEPDPDVFITKIDDMLLNAYYQADKKRVTESSNIFRKIYNEALKK